MESYVYKKEVDWSLFNYGFAIPLEYQVIFKQIRDRFIERGESKAVHLYLNGKSYTAKLHNNNIAKRFGSRGDIVQVRYSQNSELAIMLRGLFCHSFSYISNMKKMQKAGSKNHIALPEEYKEYLAIYTTEDDDSYVLEAITADDIAVTRKAMDGLEEKAVESDMDYEIKDAGAGIRVIEGLKKVRKLNHLIGYNLKLLYGFRCQICGNIIGEEFGAHVVEAHHIDYFVKSLNNDLSNQLIVCPNHHSIIHAMNPIFDRKKVRYIFPNGKEQRLKLNYHIR